MRVVTANEMRKVEERAIRDFGIPSILLMENAAWAVVQEVRQVLVNRNPELRGRKVTVFVGKGNNGGDGLAVARILATLEIDVTVYSFAKPEEFKDDAELNYNLYKNTGRKLFTIEGEKQRRLVRISLSQSEVIIDAIYGTGFRGQLPGLVNGFVEEINRCSAYIISVDIPSGVEADTGNFYRGAVYASATVTFGLPKRGHFLANGPEYSGRVIVDPISIPAEYLQHEEIKSWVLTDDIVQRLIPQRSFQGHKGSHGKAVLVAGSVGMSGAAVLAGMGALRSGVGLLQVITPRGVAPSVDLALTEATVWAAEGEKYLNTDAWAVIAVHMENAKALALGPGIGKDPDFALVLDEVLRKATIPVLLDADALNLLASEPKMLENRPQTGALILTPHPGEMARLCKCSTEEVQANRFELARSKAQEWGAIVVLKGAITIVASPDGQVFFNPTGNPGLGTGGTGDVLTGSILAWLAQGVEPLQAACLGVYLHGKAADELAQDYGWSGFTATEVANHLPKARRLLEL